MAMNAECRATNAAPAIAEEKYIEGRAAVFYDPADPGTEYRFKMVNPSNPKGDPIEVRERIMPGAFDLAVRQDDVLCLYNHSESLGKRVAGRDANTLQLTIDARGLNYRCEIPNHVVGQKVKESIQRGDLDGSSFQFAPREMPDAVTWRQEQNYLVRELRLLRLFDVAPVDFPAYKATTAGLRSELRSAAEEQQLQQLLTPPAPEPDRRQADADAIAAFQLHLANSEARTDAASFDDIRSQLWRLIWASSGLNSVYIEEVYETFLIYEGGDPPAYYKQGYTVDADGRVSLSGLPVKVKEVCTYEPVA